MPQLFESLSFSPALGTATLRRRDTAYQNLELSLRIHSALSPGCIAAGAGLPQGKWWSVKMCSGIRAAACASVQLKNHNVDKSPIRAGLEVDSSERNFGYQSKTDSVFHSFDVMHPA
jgi:hypothetical protein